MASLNLALDPVAKMRFEGDGVSPKFGERGGWKEDLVTSVILPTNELTT